MNSIIHETSTFSLKYILKNQTVPKKKESFLKKFFQIAVVVVLYWLSTTFQIILNEEQTAIKVFSMQTPYLFALFKSLIAILVCFIGSLLYKILKIKGFASLKFDYKVSREVLPVSLWTVATIMTSSQTLVSISGSFSSVSSIVIIIMNIVLSYVMLKKKTSYLLLLSCSLIIVGHIVDLNHDLVTHGYQGYLMEIISGLFISFHIVYAAKILPGFNYDLWKMGYYNQCNVCVLLLPFMIKDLKAMPGYEFNLNFWFAILISGTLGFLVYLISLWQIKLTSPLTHGISGNAVHCMNDVLYVSVDKTIRPPIWWCGKTGQIMGVFIWTIVQTVSMKHHEKKRNQELSFIDVDGDTYDMV